MQFLLFSSKVPLNANMISKLSDIFNKTTSILCQSFDYEWLSEDKKTFFIGRNPKIIAYEKYNVFDTNGGLSFIHGWVKKVSEDCLLDASHITFDADEELDGLYLYAKLDENGNGFIKRSLESPPIYYAENENSYAISSRIFTLSKIFDYTKINRKHVASHIELQNLAVTDETIYENVYYVPLGSNIILSDTLEIEQIHDFLYDERLDDLYRKDTSKYWDECYARTQSQVKAFVNAGLTEHISIGITGGMDSRLLLSLYKDHISEAFTSGPAYSPEVLVAKMICTQLGIEHRTPSLKQTTNSENLIKRLPVHIFDRQFEMSPWDLGRIFPKAMNGIRLDGHEYLKQNAFTNDLSPDEALENSKKEIIHHNIINKEYSDMLVEDDLNLEKEYIEKMVDIKKYPKIRKVLNRGRWFSAAHETEFNHRFNLLPLASDTFVKYNYNGSIDSINNLECHVELLKRSTPELLDIPLFNNQFKQNPIPPLENKIKGGLNYKNIYLVKYYDYLIKFINENYHLIGDIIEKSFIDELTRDNLKSNPKLSQKVYNILEAIILFKVPDCYDLKNEWKVDFEVEKEENIDSYNEDIIKAFIEYNKDIVKLKQENNQLKNNSKETVNSTVNELENLTKIKDTLYDDKLGLEQKSEELYSIIKEKDIEIKELTDKLKESDKQNDILNNKIRSLEKFNHDKEILIPKLRTNNEELKEKTEELYSVVINKNKKIEEYSSSNSWKITEPLRRISNTIRKKKP